MRILRIFAGLGLLILFSASSVLAQGTGLITGTVRDSSGAVVPGAEVKVASAAIGLTRTTTTNAAGDYLAAGLPAGTYDLTVTAKGFKVFEIKGVIVRVVERARVDVTLDLGAVSETVVVTGENVAQVETQSSELSGVVTGKQISQLQLNGRSFLQLVTLVPGVSDQTGNEAGQVGLNANISFDINGGRAEYNNWQLDGANNMDTGSNDTLDVFPNLDAIAEFRVMTSNYGAQFGRNGSASIQVITKSGTKNFHGDVYEFARNEFFNANDFFDNAAGNSRPQYKKHQFGYTIGGPVLLPGYNKNRDKTFFFWAQEWHREHNPFSFNQLVPSNAERGGHFDDLCPTAGSLFIRSNDGTAPASTPTFPECPGTMAIGQFIGKNQEFNTFPGNSVTIDPNAQAMLTALIPPGNVGSGAATSFITSVTEPLTWRQELVRVDHNFTPKLRAMVRYIHDTYNTVDPTVAFVSNPFPTVQTKEGTPGTSFVLNLTAAASPTLLNEFIFSYAADHLFLTNTGNFQVPSNFTMTSIFRTGTNGARLFQLPAVSLLNGAAYGGGFTINPGFMPWENANPTYGYHDNVTKVIGKHNLQFGGELIAIQKNEPSAPTSIGLGGVLNFDETNSVNPSTGNSFADFLIGDIASYQQTSAIKRYFYRYKIFEPYFQDDWHITRRLTLNLGLRVSLFQTNRDVSRTSFNFDPAVYLASASKAPTIAPDGSLVPGSGNPFLGFVQCGGPGGTASIPGPILKSFPAATVAGTSLPGCVKGHLFNPGPRLGFAFDPRGDGKMAIRGGYGIFFEYGNGNEANAESLEGTPPPVLTSTQFNVAPLQGSCKPPQTGYACIGAGAELFPSAVNNEPPSIIQTHAIWPYVQQWHLDYQFEVLRNTVASVSYVGSKGTHLTDTRDINQLHSLQPALNPYKPGQAIGPNDCTTGTTPSGVAITGQAAINLGVACGNDPDPARPFRGFGTLELLETQANSSYHAFQASLKRSVGSLILNFAYTYSHSIDDFSDRGFGALPSSNCICFVDSYNLRGNRASSDFDQRHLLNISSVYDLPFFNKSSGLKRTLLGGWQWTVIASFQSGTPLQISNTDFGDNAGVGNGVGLGSRPDLVGNPHAHSCLASTATLPGPFLFNACAFADPRGLTFGNIGRNFLNLPFHSNFDMGLFKHFPIKESTAVEFRWETFNTFNHTQFNNVDASFSATSSTFLQATGTRDPRIMQFGLKFLF